MPTTGSASQSLLRLLATFFYSKKGTEYIFFFIFLLCFPLLSSIIIPNTFVRALYANVCIRFRHSPRQRFDLSLLVVDLVSLLTGHAHLSLSPVPSDCGHHAFRDGTCMWVQQCSARSAIIPDRWRNFHSVRVHHSSRYYCCCGRQQTKRVASRRRNE